MLTHSADDLRACHCWFDVDRVPSDEATTAWKRKARLGQAKWREKQGFPIGSEPYVGGPDARPIGSRIELGFAIKTGANFLYPEALAAVQNRLAQPEPHQTLREDRLWADLLSSMPLCFNLFGGLQADPEAANRAIAAWLPEAPSGKIRVRFEHSPGRRDPLFLNNRSAFDVAFEIMGDKGTAVIGVETKYHEHTRPEKVPSEAALARYAEVTERSGAFVDGWQKLVVGTELQQIWLDHLLVLAMLQHPSGRWNWGRFLLVYPAGNPSIKAAAERYRGVLRDSGTFEGRTIEQLLGTKGAMREEWVRALKARYLGDSGGLGEHRVQLA